MLRQFVVFFGRHLKREHGSINDNFNDSTQKRLLAHGRKSLILLVGATGFEPATPCAQGRCATRLRYAPTQIP